MQGTMLKFLLKVAVPVFLAVQALPVSAGEHNTGMKQMPPQTQTRQVRETGRYSKPEEQQIGKRDAQEKSQPIHKQPVGYVSLISLIINDALGQTNQNLRIHRINEAGKISH